MKPLKSIYRFCVKAEDLYYPGFPPMSPITNSYYAMWVMLDVAFGPDKETVGSCLVDLADIIGIGGVSLTALENLSKSRMGIYKVIKANGVYYTAREVVTDKIHEVQVNSGYVGRKNDLILIRLLPSLDGSNMCTSMTTPYQLEGYDEESWVEYFKRQGVSSEYVGFEQKLYDHMKYGPEQMYWSEYIFYAYLHYRSDVVFLTGLPDRPSTQPHHDDFNDIATSRRALNKVNRLTPRHLR